MPAKKSNQQGKKTGKRVVGSVNIGGDVAGRDINIAGGNVMVNKSIVSVSNEISSSRPNVRIQQLPLLLGDFTGREQELFELISAVKDGMNIIGLHGVGGVGKTSLAIMLADRLVFEYSDAQLFLDLKGTSHDPVLPIDAMKQIIRAYQTSTPLPEKESDVVTLYLNVLKGQRAIIILDDAANSDQLRALIPPRSCLLIVTSRRRFTLPGLQYAKIIDVLPEIDAFKLLLTIAPKIGKLASAIASLCGYLPLALRQVATLVSENPTLTPDTLEKQFRDTKNQLNLTGSEISLGLTYGMLTSDLQRKWSMLSIFPSSFDVTAASAIWKSDSSKARRVISSLQKYSLLEYLPKQRRYFIPTMARTYADTRLEPEEHDKAALRHTEHFLNVLKMLNNLYLGKKQGDKSNIILANEEWNEIRAGQKWSDASLILLYREWDNIRAGQSWVASHTLEAKSFSKLCSDYGIVGKDILDIYLTSLEKLRWLDDALAAARFLEDTIAECKHLDNTGHIYVDLGNNDQAITVFEQALSIAEKLGDEHAVQSIFEGLGNAYRTKSDIRRAIEFYEKGLSIARKISDHRGEQSILVGLGHAYANLGEIKAAIKFYEQALSITQQTGDRLDEEHALGNLGDVYVDISDIPTAIEFYKKALSIAREIGDLVEEERVLGSLGNVYENIGDNQEATEFYEQALAIARKIGDRVSEGAYLGNLGLVYADIGEHQQAIDLYEQRLIIAREIGDKRDEGNALGNIGNVYFSLNEFVRAIECYEKARVIAREIGDRIGEATASGGIGSAYLELGEIERSIQHFDKQLKIVRDIGERHEEGITLLNLGIAYSRLNDIDHSIENFQQAVLIMRETSDLLLEGDVLSELSEVLQIKGDYLQAASATIEAFKAYELVGAHDIEKIRSSALKFLTHVDTEVRQFAVGALAGQVTENDDIRIAFIARLSDTNQSVRSLAVDALGPLAVNDVGVRKALLSKLDDETSEVQQQIIKYLSGFVSTDPDVRAAIFPRISRPTYEKPSLEAIARDFFSAAGFEVRPTSSPLEFVCYPVADFWKAKIYQPIYTQCLIDRPLDRDIVMSIYGAAGAIIDSPKYIFVVISQTPEESGLIEISALRASEGVQIVPVDNAVIQQGRELQKEQEKLREYLSRFIGNRNLYDVRNPVVDRLNFFGRETKASELLEVLSEGRPLALFGLRKMGKSSLVQHLRDNSPFPVAYVDLQAGEELSALYNRILGSWQRSLRVHLPGFDWIPSKISAEASSGFGTATHELMTRLESSGHSSRLGVFIDEIEVIVPHVQSVEGLINPDELNRYLSFARALRGIVQETDRLSLLMIGVDPQFNRISRWLGQQNPFYQFFREEYLGPLSREDCIQMIRHIGRQMDIEYSDDAVNFVAEVSGGHPFLARQLCSATLETMENRVATKITLDDIIDAARVFIQRPGTADLVNENGLWGEVTDPILWPKMQVIENQNILTHLARHEAQQEKEILANGQDRVARERSVFELEHRAVLGRLEQSLKIQFGLFRHWIEKYQLKGE